MILTLWAGPVADAVAFILAVAFMIYEFKLINNDEKSKATDDAEESSAVLKPSKKGVIITIAREHGSMGKQVGKAVAEKLGIPFYYKEVTALAAQESGLDREFISDINKNSPDMLRTLYLSTDVVQQAVVAQDKIIRKIADGGSCVIVGRAADYVLRDYEDVVRIFIYAPEDYRIKSVMEMYDDTAEAAKKHIHRADGARASYYNNISERTWGDRRNYELMIDSSVGIETTADMICHYIGNRKQ